MFKVTSESGQKESTDCQTDIRAAMLESTYDEYLSDKVYTPHCVKKIIFM